MDIESPALTEDDGEPPVAEPARLSRARVWLLRIGGVLWIGVLAWALYGLNREWSAFHFDDLDDAFARIGASHLLMALGFTVLSYLCNAGLGMIAQHWLKQRTAPPLHNLARNFVISAFTMNAGGSVLGGGSIRLRFAAEQGVTPADVGKVTLFTGLAGWAGHILLSGLLLWFAAPPLGWLPENVAHLAGAVLLIAGVLMPFGGLLWPRVWPRPGFAWLTTLVSMLDWLFAGLAMWALFPGALPMSAWSLVAVVVVAQALASFTHVPGGIGILELALTKALAVAITAPVLAGTLVTYRLLYYLLPFGAAIVMVGGRELHRRRDALRSGGRLVLKGWSMIAPRLAALLALGGGFMLLLSANTPMEPSRRGIVALLPLPFVEASHFISSMTGAVLIVLARGLQRRVQMAWWLSVAAMAGGVVFSLTKGFDWEEALILIFMLICLLTSREHFHRHAAVWTHRFTTGWWLMLATLIGVTVWVGFFTARHVPYQSDLWWRFALEGDASRLLRACLGAGCVVLITGIAQALHPARKHQVRPVDWPVVDKLIETSRHTESSLAWLGDKEFTISEDGRCGLMHADQGRSRIVMGDPLGDSDAGGDVLWTFIEDAEDEGMRPVFYQVSVAEMPRLVDMGLKLYKLGEQATVALADFSLEGGDAKKLRQARNRFERAGLTFVIWSPEEVVQNMDVLQAISDSWLEQHQAGEKGFSLGRFDPDYLKHFSCAVAQEKDGRVIAFANIWQTTDRSNLSIDLMRHLPDPPNSIMEAMVVELMFWGREQGYERFDLGMAPLSGLSTHPLAPLWHQLAARIFRRGGSLYNFTGLRAWKEKFNPQWEPRYIAVPGAWSLPAALLDATALIGGGLRRTFARSKS